ncbi:MAG TPA: septal ring lytic transglycosylase RlpA family protein [Acidobacteriaceae bacterium]
MPKYLKLDLIATSIAVTLLAAASATFLYIVPTLTTPVMADASLVMGPVTVPSLPALTPSRHKSIWSDPLSGIASWYGAVRQGHHTASGERFDKDELTAAHRTLPFGTLVRVVDVTSGKSVVVRINDRGVLFPGRVIDLSSAAADDLGILRSGVARVRLEILRKVASADAKTSAADPKAAPAEPTPVQDALLR